MRLLLFPSVGAHRSRRPGVATTQKGHDIHDGPVARCVPMAGRTRVGVAVVAVLSLRQVPRHDAFGLIRCIRTQWWHALFPSGRGSVYLVRLWIGQGMR